MKTSHSKQTHYIKTKDQCRVYYETYLPKKGNKPTLVLLHGLNCNITVWKNYIPFFIAYNYPVIAMDLRGHGNSSKNAEITFAAAAEDLKAILNKEKIKR